MSKDHDYIEKIDGAERRYAVTEMTVEKRAAEGEAPEAFVVKGYAARFNSITVIGNYFREEILVGAFDDVLDDDIRCLFNHDANKILARCINRKGTLTVGVDDKGLWYEYVTPQRQYALDLADAIDKGDVSQSSFAFRPKETVWIEKEGELDLRQIKKMEMLYDVSPVTYPAYQDTTVGKRTHDARLAEKQKDIDEAQQRSGENKGLSIREAQLQLNKNKR